MMKFVKRRYSITTLTLIFLFSGIMAWEWYDEEARLADALSGNCINLNKKSTFTYEFSAKCGHFQYGMVTFDTLITWIKWIKKKINLILSASAKTV